MTARQVFSVVLATLFFALLAIVSPAHAQSSPTPANLSQIDQQSPQYANMVFYNIMHGASCILTGTSVLLQPCLEYSFMQNAQGHLSSTPVLSSVDFSAGLLGIVTSSTASLASSPPLSTGEYIASLQQKFNPIKEAHAQVGGSGDHVLSPVIKLWSVSRNVSYLAMIVIFLTIGMMIMFRSRINPQTVISVQAALPGLVIGLIMITFSYFFASLITDVAFIGTDIVGYYFAFANDTTSANLLVNLSGENVVTLMSGFVGVNDGTGGKPWDMFIPGVQTLLDNLRGFANTAVHAAIALIAYQIGASLGGPMGALGGLASCSVLALAGTPVPIVGQIVWAAVPACGTLGNIVGGATGGIAAAGFAFLKPQVAVAIAIWVVLLFAVIFTMVRLLFRLISNYLQIVFYTITAPFYFLLASLPGRQSIATNWVVNMLCNVLAFPAVIAAFYFIVFLLGPDAQGLWVEKNPFPVNQTLSPAGMGTLPLFGGFDLRFIRLLMAFGLLLATPAIPEIICRAIGKLGPAGQLIQGEFSAAQKGGQGYMGRAGSLVQGPMKTGQQLNQLREEPGWHIDPDTGTWIRGGHGSRPSPWGMIRLARYH